jgi:hypothetical protein
MWQEMQAREPLLFGTAVGHLALLAVLAVLALVDDTALTGVNRWVKPMKFCASIAIYLASLAWYWPLVVASTGAKRVAAMLLAGTLIIEMIWIIGQAARGVRSHFNIESPLDGAAFQLAGLVILINVATAAWACWRTLQVDGSPYVWGVRLGLASFVIFALEGIVMVRRMGHAVGVPDGGPGLPGVNWSTTGGDLRVAHFLGMHALQLLPLIGYLTGRTGAVLVAFALWLALSAGAFVQALSGKPLLKG